MSADAPCRRCRTPLEPGDLRCAICGEPTPGDAQQRESVEVRVLRCGQCAAVVEFNPALQGLHCAFCDSTVREEKVAQPLEQVESWLPFSVSAEQARTALRGWLGGLGFFYPSDLPQRARVEALRPLWWAGWAFDAEALASWTADSDAGAGRSSWAPHAGQRMLRFDDVIVSASRGLSEEETHKVSRPCDLKTAQTNPSGPADATREQFDLVRAQGRARVVAVARVLAVDRIARHEVPGTRFRHVKAELQLRALTTRRHGFPAWVTAYRYRGELYRAVVCGQDASCVLGRAPISWVKVALVVALGLLLLAVVAAAVFSN